MVAKQSLIKNEIALAHILMIFLVITWGFDYVPAKWGLAIMPPMTLLFLKYVTGDIVLVIILLIMRKKIVFHKRDIPVFIVCAFFGEILYFGCEYSAMSYLPVSLITIILSFVPVLSIISERILFNKRQNKIIIVGIIVCIAGVILVIGTDYHILFQGRGIGYLLAIGAVFCWNVYNYVTSSLKEYDSFSLSFLQMLCTVILISPVAIHSMPPASEFTSSIIFGIIWIGTIDAGLGFLIYVYSLQKLGPTTTVLYSNFMPVSTTFFGAIMLHESITAFQIIGGIIVIASAFVVIREKGKLDSL